MIRFKLENGFLWFVWSYGAVEIVGMKGNLF